MSGASPQFEDPVGTAWKSFRELAGRFFSQVFLILTDPTKFFRRMPSRAGLSAPLAFALVNHWIGSALGFVWQLAVGASLSKYFSYLSQITGDVLDVDSPGAGENFLMVKDRIFAWFTGAGPVVVDPFVTLVVTLSTAFFVYIGAKILVPRQSDEPRELVTFESAVKITCYGTTPAILAAVPLFGGLISSIGIVIVTVVGVREVYRVGTARALVIALFPKLLFFGMVGVGLLTVGLLLFQMISSLFM